MEKVDSWGFPINDKEKKDSDFFKLKDKIKDGEGDTKLRVLTQPIPVYKLTKGDYPKAEDLGYVDENYRAKEGEKVAIKGWVWAAIRGEADLKIVTLPYSVISLIQQLRSNDEYAFDEFPMPYDITIHNTGEGANRYSVTAARKNSPVTAEELSALTLKTPIADIIRKMKDKKAGISPEVREMPVAEEEIRLEDIPF